MTSGRTSRPRTTSGRVVRLLDHVIEGAALAGVACLGLAIIATTADVIGRRGLGFQVTGTVDLTQLAVVTCAFLSLPFGFRRGAHVAVEILDDRASPLVLRALDLFAGLLGLVVMGVIAWRGLDELFLALDYGSLSQDLGLPLWIHRSLVVAGGSLGALACLMNMGEALGLLPGRTPAHGPDRAGAGATVSVSATKG
ncbi:TRAP transporter small permease [Tistrella bauzanensis]|uniref:TRAP transporter small permease n=1 Tax=Tistrella TaxID=171436 RepID=UPI0031F68156